MTGLETATLVERVQTWRYTVDPRQYGFFLAKKQREFSSTSRFGGTEDQVGNSASVEETTHRPTTPGTPGDALGFTWMIGSLADFEHGFFGDTPSKDCFVCFTDPSTYPTYPGWMLRNLLILVRRRWRLERVQILCYRDVQARRDDAKSIILSLELGDKVSVSSSVQTLASETSNMPRVTGWERNSAGKVMSRIANLGEYMDPQRYAQAFVSNPISGANIWIAWPTRQ